MNCRKQEANSNKRVTGHFGNISLCIKHIAHEKSKFIANDDHDNLHIHYKGEYAGPGIKFSLEFLGFFFWEREEDERSNIEEEAHEDKKVGVLLLLFLFNVEA